METRQKLKNDEIHERGGGGEKSMKGCLGTKNPLLVARVPGFGSYVAGSGCCSATEQCIGFMFAVSLA